MECNSCKDTGWRESAEVAGVYAPCDVIGCAAGPRILATFKRSAATPEPVPTGSGAIVLDAVLAKIDGITLIPDAPSAITKERLGRVRADLVARAEFGLKKYGTKLRVNNGRNATNDLYQEALDAVMYAQQCRLEGLPSGGYLESFLNLAAMIASDLAMQEQNAKATR